MKKKKIEIKMTISEAKQDLSKQISSRKYVISMGISSLKILFDLNKFFIPKDEYAILVYLNPDLMPAKPKLPSEHQGYKIVYKYQPTEIKKQ